MDTIKEITKWLMPVCITGGAVRAIYCFIISNYNEDDAAMYKRRARNAVIFAIMSALTEAIKQLVEFYYNGGKSI